MAALLLALGCLPLVSCGDRAGEAESRPGGRRMTGALPTPAGANGGSVTGMPTQAPAAGVAADAVAAAPPVPPPAPVTDTLPPPDPGAIPIDPATGMAAPADSPAAALTPQDLNAAGGVVRDYMAALGSGAFAGAQQLWSTTPNDGAILQLARAPAFAADVMAAVPTPDPAAVGVAMVPVRVRGSGDAGERALSATYTVRRGADGAWRIASANVREDAP
jgi:hypothetical protein